MTTIGARLAGITAAVVATGGVLGGCAAVTPPAPVTPGHAPAPAQQSYAEFSGAGQAMVTVMEDGGTSSNTVDLPHRVDIGDGFVTVTVTRAPSVESYMNGGQGDAGSVGCRIVRDGKVVEEQTAQGQFATATCSKYL